LNFGPLLPEIGEFWSTFWHFRKALGQGYKPTKFRGPKFKKQKFRSKLTWDPPPLPIPGVHERVRKDYIGIEWYRLNIPPHYNFKSVLQKKQLWLQMDSDLLNKPDLNTRQCHDVVSMSSMSSMSARQISSTIFPIMYLPDLPLAILQC